jgi:DNA-binding transcriptional LysR family regulator
VKAIADTRSLGGAAQELSVNHSTVFRRLAQIEEQLGSRLFERSRGGYALTPCGEEMVRLAERMGEDIVAFERQVTGHDLRPSGELRVTTNDTALIYLMTQVFAGFRQAYPEISLDVVVANQALNLSKRDADVAIRATERPPDTLIGRRIAGIAWAVFAATDKAPETFDPQTDCARCRVDRLRRQPREPESREVAQGAWRAGASSIASTRCWAWRRRPPPESASAPALLHRRSTPGLTRLTRRSRRRDGLWLLTHADLRADRARARLHGFRRRAKSPSSARQ